MKTVFELIKNSAFLEGAILKKGEFKSHIRPGYSILLSHVHVNQINWYRRYINMESVVAVSHVINFASGM